MAADDGQNPNDINALNETLQVLEKLSAQMKQNTEYVREMSSAMRDLTETITDTGVASSRFMQQAMRDLSDAARDSSRSTRGAKDALDNWAKTGEGAMSQLAKSFGIVKDADSTFMGFAANVMSGKINLQSLTKGLKASFGVFLVAISITNKFASSMYNLAKATDTAVADLNRATAAGTKFAAEIASMSPHMSAANVSVKELSETYGDLASNFLAFNKLNESQRRGVVETTAVLNELGVAGETTSENFNILMSSFRMTQEEASRFQREMFVIAQESMIPPEVMAAGFKQAIPQLAAFGKQATSVYAKLAVNAKAASMSTQEILNITEKFDRFDTAAESVGKLNAILGGPYLSTTRMIRQTDPTERIRMLSDAARDAGKSFDSMQYFERKALAAAMGLQDVNQLALVMNNQFDLLAPNVERSASEITELAKKTAEFNSIVDVIKNTFMSLIVNLGPVVTGIKNMVGAFQSLLFKYPAIKIVLAGIAMGLAAIAAGLAGGPIGVTISIMVGGLIVAFSILISSLSALKNMMMEASAATLVLSAAILLLTAPLWLALSPFIALAAGIYVGIKMTIAVIKMLYNAMQPALEAIGSMVEMFNELAQPALDLMREEFSLLSEAVTDLYNSVESLFKDVFTDLLPVLYVVGAVVGVILLGAFKTLVAIIATVTFVIRKLTEFITVLVNIVRVLRNAVVYVMSPFGLLYDLVSSVKESFMQGASAMETFSNMISKVVSSLDSLGGVQERMESLDKFFNIGEDFGRLMSYFEQYSSALESISGINPLNIMYETLTLIGNAFDYIISSIETIIGLSQVLAEAMTTPIEATMATFKSMSENQKTINATMEIANAGADAAEAVYNFDMKELADAVKQIGDSTTTIVLESSDGFFREVRREVAQGKKDIQNQMMGKPPITSTP